MKVAYLGNKTSHTFAAAHAICGDKVDYHGLETITKCMQSVSRQECDIAVVPLENSVEGAVSETFTNLIQESLYIKKAILMPIVENFITSSTAKKEDIEVIYSHPQALSQCREFILKNFPNAQTFALSSTSKALDKIDSDKVAAIARVIANDSQKIMFADIHDYDSNATMFVVLSLKPGFEGNKCSIAFETEDKPGALLQVLNQIADNNINMTKIISRPSKTGFGKYVFFVDLDFDKSKEELNEFLSLLQKKTSFLKFLGKYNSDIC